MPSGIIDTSSGFLLGPHQVLPDRNCVILGETAVSLEPKIMDVCRMLASRGGEVFSREELIDAVWGVKFGSDESLTRAIYVLRKTFGGEPSSKAIIETVSKRGYRLAAPILPLQARPQTSASVSREIRPSIAVLAFVDMSESCDQEHLSDGVSEEIINALVPLKGLKVAGRTSSFSFKRSNKAISEIAFALNVDYVLEGSVRKHGERLRITAQLINARDDAHLWSHNFDGHVDQLFDLQDKIARSVCNELKVILHVDEGPSRLAPALTSSHQAYELFLQGRALSARIFGAGVLEQAEAYFKRAIAIDPDFAEAWGELGYAYAQMASYIQGDDRRAILARSNEAAQKAIDLKPGYGFAWMVLSWTPLTLGDITESARLAEKGLSLSPDNPDVLIRSGYYLLVIGRVAEAIPLIKQAVELDPIQGRNHMILAMALLAAGDLAGAEDHAERAIGLQYHAASMPGGLAAHAAGNASLAIERHMRAAETAASRAFTSEMATPEIWKMVTAIMFAGTNEQRAGLVAHMSALVTEPAKRSDIAYLHVLLACGAYAEFIDAFGERAEPGNHLILCLLWCNFAPQNGLRDHPDFMAFATRIGLKAAWDAYGYPDCWHGAPPVLA